MPDNSNYEQYQELDFLNDPSFQDGVIDPEGPAAAFWQTWLSEHPAQQEAAAHARRILVGIGFKEHYPDEQRVGAALQRMLAVIDGEIQPAIDREMQPVIDGEMRPVIDEEMRPHHGRRVVHLRRWVAAAAILLLVAATAVLINLSTNHRITLATPYASTRTLHWADSSLIVLNAHSSLSYNHRDPREVWLKGEAWFKVKKTEASYRGFRVHTSGLTVEVLGTSFDIRERRGRTEVALEEGKIRLLFEGGAHTDIVMAPGERVVFDTVAHTVARMRDSFATGNFSSWKEGRLTMTDANLSQIIAYIEDNYGKKIILEDPQLGEKKIRGDLLLDDLDDILFVLSKVADIRIVQQQDTILFRRR